MKRVMVVLTIWVVGFACSAGSALAQGQAAPAPSVEVSAGYQFQRFEGGVNFPKGWYADVAKSVTRAVSVVGQVTGTYKSDSTTFSSFSSDVSMSIYSFLGGVRLSSRTAKGTIFAHAMAGDWRLGASQTSSFPSASSTYKEVENHLALVGGAGFTARITDRVSLRGGGDYVRVFFHGDSGWSLRGQAGLVFGFGAR